MPEPITYRNARFLPVVICLSTSVVLGFPADVGQDAWVSLLGSMLLVVPLMLVYGRLLKLMPGYNIYTMAERTFGKPGKKVVSLLFGFYCIHVVSLIIYSFAIFIKMTSLSNTPAVVIMVLLFAAGLYLAKSGMNTLGRTSVIVVFLSCFTMLSVLLFSLPKMDFQNMLPVFSYDFPEYAKTSWKIAVQPFGEVVVTLALFDHLEQKKGSPYKLYLFGTALTLIYLLIVFVRTVSILGIQGVGSVYFPNYRSVALIQISDFIERVESVVAFVYIFGSIAKIAAFLIAGAKGVANLFDFEDYKPMVTPVAFFALGLATFAFDSILQMFSFLIIYTIYAIPFQTGIPLVIWIAAELKARKGTLLPPVQTADPAG